jgi:hypothetical protein
MSGTNAFKRGVQDRRLSRNLIDTFPEDLKEEIVTDIFGRRFYRPLPTDQQRDTDPVQQKAHPVYKLIRDNDCEVVTRTCTCGKCCRR